MQIAKVELFKFGYGYICNDGNLQLNDNIVVESPRGQELATVVNLNTKYDTNEDMLTFVRIATESDIEKAHSNFLDARKLEGEVKSLINKNKINLKLCFVNYNLDKSKLIIYYTADGRVDFRNLVKDLANSVHTRIEMRQIGNRDEVQIVGGVGLCGRVCCCKLMSCTSDKINIKMAKNQGLALNPTKINGVCNRLLCCLKYEDDNYREILAKMPKVGTIVRTPNGDGKVQFIDILKEEVTVIISQKDENEKKTFKLAEITFDKSKCGYYE